MTNGEAVNWIINISADVGKAEHRDLWHYEQALSEIRELLESAEPERKTGRWIHDGCQFKGGIDWMHCSECGHKDKWNAVRTPFCAWCGARMEGES